MALVRVHLPMQVDAGPLSWEDALEEGMATHSSILAWKIPWTDGTWQATVRRVTQSRSRLKLAF